MPRSKIRWPRLLKRHGGFLFGVKVDSAAYIVVMMRSSAATHIITPEKIVFKNGSSFSPLDSNL